MEYLKLINEELMTRSFLYITFTKYRFLFVLLGLISSSQLLAQDFFPGESYLDSSSFVQYRAGNSPIILSAPHGGDLMPDTIPDRSVGTFVKDSWTAEVSNGVYDRIFELTGCYPHLVVNLLHRVKFDANRDIEEAADGNSHVEQAWRGYHRFIEAAKDSLSVEDNRGVFFDMHGHGHDIQRIELGYLLNRTDLDNTDEDLNLAPLSNESSIRTLIDQNLLGETHAELLRGDFAFGTILEDRGFPATPSNADPMPGINNPFFSGGFNTVKHGSRDNQGSVDAIQVELNQSIRFDDDRRDELIDSLAQSILDFYYLHYPESGCLDRDQDNDGYDYTVDCDDTNPDIYPGAMEIANNGIDEDCDGMDLLSAIQDHLVNPFKIYPNPVSEILFIDKIDNADYEIALFNVYGLKVLEARNVDRIVCSILASGTYLMRIELTARGKIYYQRIVVE